LYVRDVLMWGAFICGVGAIPVLLAMNAVDERAAMAPPPAARALSGVPGLPAPEALPSWTPPVASATGSTPGMQEPARTGTLPARTPPAPALADSPTGSGADPIEFPRAVASDSATDSVPLPRPGEPRPPISQSLEVSPPTVREPVSQPDALSTDSGAGSTTGAPTAQEAGASRGVANPEPVQSASATNSLTPAEKSALDAVSPPEPDRLPRSVTNSAASDPASRSDSGPGLPPVRPSAPAPAQPLASDRAEFASLVVPPKRHEPPKRRMPSSKRRKAPPAALPTIPLEQQFEWIQQ
jgi:hypothetical protein